MGTGKKFVMNCYNFCNLLLCYIHFLTHSFVCSDISELEDIQKKYTERKLYFNHTDTFLYLPTNLKESLEEIQNTEPCVASTYDLKWCVNDVLGKKPSIKYFIKHII